MQHHLNHSLQFPLVWLILLVLQPWLWSVWLLQLEQAMLPVLLNLHLLSFQLTPLLPLLNLPPNKSQNPKPNLILPLSMPTLLLLNLPRSELARMPTLLAPPPAGNTSRLGRNELDRQTVVSAAEEDEVPPSKRARRARQDKDFVSS